MSIGKRATYESSHKERQLWRFYWDSVFSKKRYPQGSYEESVYNKIKRKLYTERYARKI